MCNNCYHLVGREKKAWKCEHTSKTHYAKGICQNCYQTKYMKNSKKTKNSNRSKSCSEISENKSQVSEIDCVKEEAENGNNY